MTSPLRSLVLLACATVCSATLRAQSPIRLLTPASSRTASCNGADLGFAGPFFNAAQRALGSPSNFGPSGTVPRAVSIGTSARLDAIALAAADVVVLTRTDAPRLDVEERMAIDSFVLAGGGLVVLADGAAQELVDLVGCAVGGVHTAAATVVDAASPLTNGPFGSLAAGSTVGHGPCGSFADVGPDGNAVLAVGGSTFAATFVLGQGRVAAFADEEMFMDRTSPGCVSLAWSVTSRTLVLNTIAWVAPAVGFAFDPASARLGALGTACANGVPPAPAFAVLGQPLANERLRFLVESSAPGRFALVGLAEAAGQTPFAGCSIFLNGPLVQTWLLQLGPAGSARPGTAVVEVLVPALPYSAVLFGQAVVLDERSTSGITATAAARFVL